MRRSVAAKKARAQAQKRQQHQRHQRIALWLAVPLAGAVGLLALSCANYSATAQVHAAEQAIAADQSEMQEYIKIAAAKRQEAEAKAAIEAEIAAKAESERQIAAAKQTNPSTDTSACATANLESITVVINKKHCFSPIDWMPPDLTSVDGFLLRKEAAQQMSALMQAARAAGSGFSMSSAYRSYANQQATYDTWVRVNGSAALADTVSARPGYSEHQTGLAADLKTDGCALECFSGTSAYAWLKANAANYGFIERYPAGLSDITGYAPETWHWRYVGAATAKDMKQKGIQTLEQYFGITGGTY